MLKDRKGNDGHTRALVGMFGLNRFPEMTEDPIIENILQPLQNEFSEVDVFAHFNVPEIIDNPRSSESTAKFINKDFRFISFKKLVLEKQSTFYSDSLFSRLESVPLYKEIDMGGSSRRNIGYQLSSLRRLLEIIKSEGQREYDLYVIIRPDLIYHDAISRGDMSGILTGRYDIIVPRWQSSGGINDRFCMANYKGAAAYMNRIDGVDRFCIDNGFIHSERLLYEVVRAEKLRVGYIANRASRVRTGGKIHPENFGDNWMQFVKRLFRRAEASLKR